MNVTSVRNEYEEIKMQEYKNSVTGTSDCGYGQYYNWEGVKYSKDEDRFKRIIERLDNQIEELDDQLTCERKTLEVAMMEAAERDQKLQKKLETAQAALQLQRSELVLELQPLLDMSDATSVQAIRNFLVKLVAKINVGIPTNGNLLKEAPAALKTTVVKIHKIL